MIAGGEETYRFFYHLQAKYPDEYRQVCMYPGDWQMIYHMAKALMGRNRGAGVESVAEALCTDDNYSGDGSNCRRAHHHVTVMFEAVRAISKDCYFKQCLVTMEKPAGHDDHVDCIFR